MTHQNDSSILTQETVLKVRARFFDALEREWSRGPSRIDLIMNQDMFYVPPESLQDGGERICDVETGVLTRSFSLKRGDKYIRFFYSIFQAGDWLRYGILIKGLPEFINLLSETNLNKSLSELENIWDRSADSFVREKNMFLLEWRFTEKDFYTNFAIEERFVHISRHLHFRLSRELYISMLEIWPEILLEEEPNIINGVSVLGVSKREDLRKRFSDVSITDTSSNPNIDSD